MSSSTSVLLDPEVIHSAVSVLSVLLLLVIIGRPCKYNDNKDKWNGTSLTTASISDLVKMLKAKSDYLKTRDCILTPVNKACLDKYNSLVPTANFNNIPGLIQACPGNNYGFYPLQSMCCPNDLVIFAFDQGRIGWYWLYLTFPDTKSELMFQLTRVEILPQKERKKLGYTDGQSTVYQISVGVSVNGKWFRNNYYADGGTFQVTDKLNFNFVSANGSFKFSHSYDSTNTRPYLLSFSWVLPMTTTDSSAASELPDNGTFTISASCSSAVPIYKNASTACIPCLWGDGTLYASYTDLQGSGQVTMEASDPANPDSPSKIYNYTLQNGIGWMDHQWGGSESSSMIGKILTNVINKGDVQASLPMYIWLNLHVNNDVQYMVYAFPKDVLKVGDILDATAILYTPTKRNYNIKASVKVTAVVSLNDINYPDCYEITINDDIYTLDNRPYGKCAILDISYSDHWTGSADLYLNGTIIGTGFMEGQKFIGEETSNKLIWQGAGSTEDLGSWQLKQKNMFSFISCLILLILLLLSIGIVIFGFLRVVVKKF